MKFLKNPYVLLNVALAVAIAGAFLMGADVSALLSPEAAGTLLLADAVSVADLNKLEGAMKKVFDEMGVNLRKAQDAADKALDENKKLGGTIEAKTNDLLGKIDADRVKLQGEAKALRDEFTALAQKAGKNPGAGSGEAYKSIHEIVTASEEYKRAARAGRMEDVNIGSFHKHLAVMEGKTSIFNATLNESQPLVAPVRVAGIITPPEQRLYIRDLLPQTTTTSNLIDFTTEATFTSNARPQGDVSPGGIEGESFAESAMTFALSNAPVVTLGHWIPASRQVLADASLLQGHISVRLLYGLKLEEEIELLNGNGQAGKLNGLTNQAAAFTGGVTNATILDTLLRAILQVSLSNFEASGFVLHPIDWYSAMLLKDTQGRYLFTNPQDMVAPRVWAKPVVPSLSMTSGKFLCGAFSLGAQIWDREDANVRISENVNDHFIKNMVAILCEERLALTVYRPTAFVYGNTSYAG